jgi:signal recognition particle GTPase
VIRILKQFEHMRKMMRTMTDSKMNAMLNNMKGMNMPRG